MKYFVEQAQIRTLVDKAIKNYGSARGAHNEMNNELEVTRTYNELWQAIDMLVDITKTQNNKK
jgi:hypothetical protein